MLLPISKTWPLMLAFHTKALSIFIFVIALLSIAKCKLPGPPSPKKTPINFPARADQNGTKLSLISRIPTALWRLDKKMSAFPRLTVTISQ
jgi:hypothetical protein